jgi:hypothetical protein
VVQPICPIYNWCHRRSWSVMWTVITNVGQEMFHNSVKPANVPRT